MQTGTLQGKTVNIKWYLKREGLLDLTAAEVLDYYLVMTGPAGAAASSRGGSRPWRIENVYLFDARRLLADQLARGYWPYLRSKQRCWRYSVRVRPQPSARDSVTW